MHYIHFLIVTDILLYFSKHFTGHPLTFIPSSYQFLLDLLLYRGLVNTPLICTSSPLVSPFEFDFSIKIYLNPCYRIIGTLVIITLWRTNRNSPIIHWSSEPLVNQNSCRQNWSPPWGGFLIQQLVPKTTHAWVFLLTFHSEIHNLFIQKPTKNIQ